MKLFIKTAVLILTAVSMLMSQDYSGYEKIKNDFSQGRISKKESILQQMFYVFDRSKLSDEYKNLTFRPIKSATVLIKNYYENLSLFSPEEQKMIDKFLSPATQSDAPMATYNSPGGKFTLTYSTTGTNAVPSADNNSNGIPDYVEWVASYCDYSWAFECDTLGFLTPPIGTGRYQIGFESMSAYGYTTPVSGQLTRIVCHNNFSGFPSNQDPEGTQKGAAKVTIAHEFKHAIQIVYNNWNDPDWFIELDATWMEDIAYDYVNDYYNYINGTGSPFKTPGEALDYGDGYEDCNWMHYLTEKNGNLFNRRLWERRKLYGSENIFTAFNNILSTYYSSTFQEAFREYGVWNFLTGTRATTSHPGYGEAAQYPTTVLCKTISTYPNTTTNCTISKYAMNHFVLNPVTSSKNISVSFNGANSPLQFKASVIVRRTNGTVTSYQLPLDANNDGSFTVPFTNSQISYAGLVVGTVADVTGPTFTFTASEVDLSGASVNVTQGWNLLSIPINASNMDFSVLFPDAASQAYIFNNGYQTVTSATVGKGFWIKFNVSNNYNISGSVSPLTSVSVTEGWNLIGPINNDIQVSAITTNPANIISSSFYEYSGSYNIVNSLVKGKGYWVKVSQNGTLNLVP